MKSRSNEVFLWRLVFCFILTQIFLIGIASVQSSAVQRLAGIDRYKTSVAVSQNGWKTADYAILARGDNFADALCAGPLAKKYNAPILLTKPDSLNYETLNEIKRLCVRHLFIIGGTGAISFNVENSLKSWGVNDIERIYGSDRYETSTKIAEKLGFVNKVIIATGDDFPDALSISVVASKLGMPILLTNKDNMSYKVKEFISSKQIIQTYIVGGTGVISDNVKNTVPNPKRLFGVNRYETNAAVIQEFLEELNFDKIFLAVGEGTNGDGFADALTGTALAAKSSSPVILVDKVISYSMESIIRPKLQLGSKVTALGGDGVVSSAVVNSVLALKDQIPVSCRYDKAGSYGPSMNSAIISGNVVISAADVTLQNTIIDGDLLLSESIGSGSVYLRGVVVKGKTFVNGGGPNSVVMYNFNGQTVVVDVPDGDSVRLVAQGSTNVPSVIMNSDGKLEESGINGSGFTTVEIPEGAQVTMAGSFGTVNVQSNGANVNVESGNISNLNVTEGAASTSIDIKSGASVSTLEAKAPLTVSGTGTISTANIRSDGVNIAQRPAVTNVDQGRSASVGGSIVSGGTTSSSGSFVGGGFSPPSTPSDTTAPVFATGYPIISNIQSTQFDLEVKTNENGMAYFVVLPNNNATPTAAEVKAGKASGGGIAVASESIALSANTNKTVTIATNISANTDYDVYVVAEDGVSNIQTSVTLTEVKTSIALAPAVDSLAWAVGGAGKTKQTGNVAVDTFYVAGTAGAYSNPGVGTAKPVEYSNALGLNTEISAASGQHIFVVTVDGSNNVTNWSDVTVVDANIGAAHIADILIFTNGSSAGTTKEIYTLTKTFKYVAGPSIARPGLGTSIDAYTGVLTQNADITIPQVGTNHLYIAELDEFGKLFAWEDVAILNTQTPSSHVQGTTTTLNIAIATVNIADGTPVTVEFVTSGGLPPDPQVKAAATGSISNNSALVVMTIPGTLPGGDFVINVITVGGLYLLTEYSIVTEGPKYVQNSFKLLKDLDNIKAEFELDQTITPPDIGDFNIAGQTPDSGYIYGKKVILQFTSQVKKTAVKQAGITAVLQTVSTNSKNTAGLSIQPINATVYDEQLPPVLNSVAAVYNISDSTTRVVLTFNENIDQSFPNGADSVTITTTNNVTLNIDRIIPGSSTTNTVTLVIKDDDTARNEGVGPGSTLCIKGKQQSNYIFDLQDNTGNKNSWAASDNDKSTGYTVTVNGVSVTTPNK